MTNLRFLLYAFIALTIAAGCKKDDDTTPLDPATPIAKHLKSVTYLDPNNTLGPNSTTKYEWDNKNRLTKVTYNDGTFSEYIYGNDEANLRLYANDPDYHFTGVAEMNNKGYFTHVGGSLYQEGEMRTYTFDCEYNNKGQLIKSTEKDGDKLNVMEFTWEGDNVKSSKEYRDGVYAFYAEYTYDTTHPDKTGFDVWHNFIETTGGTTGLRSKHLITHSKRVRVSNGEVVSDASHTYELDSDGYITKKTYADAVYSSNYQYQYNY